MESVLSLLQSLAWSPTGGYPSATPTTFKSIDPTHWPHLSELLSKALESVATATYVGDLVLLSEVIRGAQASMTVIGAQQVLATATDSAIQAKATQALFEASYNLKELATDQNLYTHYLNRGGNIFFFIVNTLILSFNVGMLFISRYHWYNLTFICGYGLEFLGFLGRILAFTDDKNINYYLLQFVCLTLSPAFIMGGIYFLFAQNVIVHGRHYSVLKPLWYSYFFVFCDVFSLVIQGLGGAMASIASKRKQDTRPGTWTMFGGILFQVLAMSVFLIFWFEFITRLYFRDADKVETDTKYKKKTIPNWLKMLFNTKSVRPYKEEELERFYNPKYASIRARKLVPYYPLAISAAVIVIFIRCIYRVIELKQGFRGYLVTHEVFLMTLDALMIAVSGLIFIPFHPVFVFGKENVLKLATIKRNTDEEKPENESESEDVTNYNEFSSAPVASEDKNH